MTNIIRTKGGTTNKFGRKLGNAEVFFVTKIRGHIISSKKVTGQSSIGGGALCAPPPPPVQIGLTYGFSKKFHCV